MSLSLARRHPIHVMVLIGVTAAAVLSQKPPGNPARGVERESPEDDEKDPSLLDADPLVRAAGDDDVRWLLKQRLQTARRVRLASMKKFRSGVPGVDTGELQARYIVAAHRVAVSQLDLATTKKERIEALEGVLAQASWHEQFVRNNIARGKMNETELSIATYERLDAQVKLSREREAQ